MSDIFLDSVVFAALKPDSLLNPCSVLNVIDKYGKHYIKKPLPPFVEFNTVKSTKITHYRTGEN